MFFSIADVVRSPVRSTTEAPGDAGSLPSFRQRVRYLTSWPGHGASKNTNPEVDAGAESGQKVVRLEDFHSEF